MDDDIDIDNNHRFTAPHRPRVEEKVNDLLVALQAMDFEYSLAVDIEEMQYGDPRLELCIDMKLWWDIFGDDDE